MLIVATAFALLAGPVRRGRPSAYVLLGFFGGYILHEYIAYRPLALWAVAGAAWWSLTDRGAGWPARIGRPLLTVLLIASMIAPLFITRIPGEFRREYYDGWQRARGIMTYYNPDDTWEQCLTVDTPEGLVVIVGCSHPGILSMLEQVKAQTGRPLHIV